MRNLLKTIALIMLSPICILYYLIGFFVFDNDCIACPQVASACETCRFKDKQRYRSGR